MYAHGKLLLTGEYFALDGALALAMPTRFGQRLSINPQPAFPFQLLWRSLTKEGEEWFSGAWTLEEGLPIMGEHTDLAVAERLQQLFLAIQKQDARGLTKLFQADVRVRLEFDREWGLGSSSTLVSLLAQISKTDPYQLLADTFGGSGYDIACATADGPILYQRHNGQPHSEPAHWEPAYHEQLYFVYLGQKQNSREGIRYYRELGGTQASLVDEVSELTRAFHQATTLIEAQQAAAAHEDFISQVLQMDKVQDQRFADFPGTIKSLGAWGGDFVMVLSDWEEERLKTYFAEKGCTAVLSYGEMKL
jgi:mevalonate kinase